MTTTPKQDELYSDENVGLKRNILMDMLGAILDNSKTTAPIPEIWKLHIDAALDQLDESVYKPHIKQEVDRAILKTATRITIGDNEQIFIENTPLDRFIDQYEATLTKSIGEKE